MKINLDNDRYFIALVKSGYLVVKKNGTILNTKTQRKIGALSNKGYVSIGHKKDGKVRHMLVHRLVFIVHKNDMKPLKAIVNHRDGIKSNNQASNLERSDNASNVQHAVDTGLRTYASIQGENSLDSKFTNATIRRWRDKHERKPFSPERKNKLAAKYNVDVRTIRNILNGQTYKYA